MLNKEAINALLGNLSIFLTGLDIDDQRKEDHAMSEKLQDVLNDYLFHSNATPELQHFKVLASRVSDYRTLDIS